MVTVSWSAAPAAVGAARGPREWGAACTRCARGEWGVWAGERGGRLRVWCCRLLTALGSWRAAPLAGGSGYVRGRILGYPQGRGPCAPVRRTRHRHRAMSSGLVNYALPVIYSCTVRRSIPGLEEMFRGPHKIARDRAGSRWIAHPERGRHARGPAHRSRSAVSDRQRSCVARAGSFSNQIRWHRKS